MTVVLTLVVCFVAALMLFVSGVVAESRGFERFRYLHVVGLMFLSVSLTLLFFLLTMFQ